MISSTNTMVKIANFTVFQSYSKSLILPILQYCEKQSEQKLFFEISFQKSTKSGIFVASEVMKVNCFEFQSS